MRIVAVDDDPDSPIDLGPDVEVVREAATPEHPPRLRTTLTNAGDEPVRVGEGRAVYFEYLTDDCGALMLLPGDACLPVGEYRFETTGSAASDDAEPQPSAQWGFSVLLEWSDRDAVRCRSYFVRRIVLGGFEPRGLESSRPLGSNRWRYLRLAELLAAG